MTLVDRASTLLQGHWWRPTPSWLAWLLWPLSWLMRGLGALHRWCTQAPAPRSLSLPVPVVVVGNLIVGGAGKTPTVIALLQWLQAHGWRPGVVSRGYGRANDDLVHVSRMSSATECGDEPLLVHLRTGAPVTVFRDRLAAARALLSAHPEVNLLLADDGLQHWRLPRDLQVLVFDGRGVGNGMTLPAGPLRQPMPNGVPARSLVLYNADQASTRWPGGQVTRRLAGAVSLVDWWSGCPPSLATLQRLAEASQATPMLAAAGLGQPERFFGMLEQEGLRIVRLPLVDHAKMIPPPWPAGSADVLLTEKDAVKLRPGDVADVRIWVITLDFKLPIDFTEAFSRALPPPYPAEP